MACVGHAALDHVFEIESHPREPTKTLARRYSMRAGGMSLHAAIAAARLGASVRLLGRVGEDAAADQLRATLAAEHVEARGLEAVRGARTSVAAVIVDAQGARQIYIHRGDALARAHALDTHQLVGADLVLVDPRWPEGAEGALQWALAHDVPSMLDADVAPQAVIDRLLKQVRWAVFSEHGLAAWAPGVPFDAALARALTAGPRLAVVTLGAQGARWIAADGGRGDVPAPLVKALDTTGAGDVFHAALALALVEDCPDAFAWACAAAAYKCEQGGGIAGAPTRAQLAAWLARRRQAT